MKFKVLAVTPWPNGGWSAQLPEMGGNSASIQFTSGTPWLAAGDDLVAETAELTPFKITAINPLLTGQTDVHVEGGGRLRLPGPAPKDWVKNKFLRLERTEPVAAKPTINPKPPAEEPAKKVVVTLPEPTALEQVPQYLEIL